MTLANDTFHKEFPFFFLASTPFRSTTSSPLSFPFLVIIMDPFLYIPIGQDSPLSASLHAPSPINSSTSRFNLMSPSTKEPPAPLIDISSTLTDDLCLPIALYKGMHLCTKHRISHFVSYDHISFVFCTFTFFMAFELILWLYVKKCYTGTWVEGGHGLESEYLSFSGDLGTSILSTWCQHCHVKIDLYSQV